MPLTPADPSLQRASRRLLAVAAFLLACAYDPILRRVLGPEGWRTPFAIELPAPAPEASGAITALWLAGSVGLWPDRTARPAATALLALGGYLLVLDQQTYSNALYALWLALLIDLCWRGARWARVARWQLSIIYGFAALAKCNATFVAGGHLARFLIGPLAPPPAWRTPETIVGLSVLAIVLEGWLAVAFWRSAWRRPAWVVGVGVHLAFAFALSPLSFQLLSFGVTMWSLYLAFGWPWRMEPARLPATARHPAAAPAAPVTVARSRGAEEASWSS